MQREPTPALMRVITANEESVTSSRDLDGIIARYAVPGIALGDGSLMGVTQGHWHLLLQGTSLKVLSKGW